ncbi:hypothetical protein [Bradyrhizobium japonicum]|uniref:hypothetical protein n=1 Tax=Bradyrhizobium japonicum TaxID=375 RepID=UPI00209DE708|nr:hypothetical protein [Bradyrhizobium japonicum]MCP1764410.1 hypothetical protein [Bradyrhizobium japonicum]MCP1786548.1 hypothetical protein [Bradyrhizobium japonicum]MCP1808427.1 hypothetical protein [Bradyrhizobium japonicum]MCP1817354.1 hypothetical protein [Bradyrhizobium japonicum]MCP1871133.1 hypothetical protein [Bradyrhizobium japonicum]
MSALSGIISNLRARLDTRAALTTLVLLHSAVACLSLIRVATFQSYIHFNGDRVWIAVAIASAFSIVSLLFAAARFSFGYFVGFYFYTMILGFLWIDVFSEYSYPQLLAGLSAGLSLILVLLPMLFVRAPFRQLVALSNARFEHLLTLILAISIGTIAVASTYNFRLVAIANIYDYRGEIAFPGPVRYLIGWVSSTLLPFAFACYWLLGHRWRAVLVVILLLFFYPITLTKFTFFTPAWLFALAVLSRFAPARTSVIFSIFIPMLIGLIANVATGASLNGIVGRYFDLVNIRMIATTSSALDIYNDFFASHPLTHFCQISLLKTVMPCAYRDQLSVVMQETYGFGMLNASLFATEGVASVGLYLAPLTALAAGFILALGNRASAGLPQRFVLISSGTLPHVLLNTPLSVAMVTHGAVLLFLLWYVTPRGIFDADRKP